MKFEIPSDLKRWYAISCPRTGLRFDSRTLEFLDSDGDGRIRSEELSAALDLVKAADRLAAYIKCKNELKTGNEEFRRACEETRARVVPP